MKKKLESDTGSNPPACSRSSETPETDAVEFEVIDDYECGINVVSSCLARKLERERNEWKANHDNQVELKRIITARPDLAERAPMVEKLMKEKRQAELLNVAFHMHIRKLERAIRKMDSAHAILPENDQTNPTR